MTEAGAIQGFVRIPDGKSEWIPILKGLYEFESSLVAGPGSSRRNITKVIWTLSKASRALGLGEQESASLRNLVSHLEKSRQLMRIPGTEGAEDCFITRVAETIRLMGHTYEYWYKGRPGIDTVRWLVEDKKIPARSIPAPEFERRILKSISESIGDGDDTFNLRKAAQVVVRRVSSVLAGGDWERGFFSQFQLDTVIGVLVSQYGRRSSAKVQILTAGVGSGKTLGFVIPTLISAVEGILGGESSRKCHLLVYPRKALAQDQSRIVSKYVDAIRTDIESLRVHLEHSTSYSSVKTGLVRVYGGLGPPPDIIITTFETLKRRLQHPLFAQKISRSLSEVVLDEIHLAEGLTGAHISVLMSRLRQAVPSRDISWIASSATVARPDEHAARIFGVSPSEVTVFAPRDEELVTVGLAHHVFLRPSGLISNLGALVNVTSLLIHSRRGDIASRSNDDKKRSKTIAFADNLDILGRWNADFRENERTESTLDRRHPDTPVADDWSARQREIPYALRFRMPLQRRIDAVGGEGDAFEPVLREWHDKRLCERCQDGERIVIGDVDGSVLDRLSRIVYRAPHHTNDKVKAMSICNPVFEQDKAKIGTLDLCPYLQAGACIWFPLGDDRSVEPIPETSMYEWRNVARSTIHSSKREVGNLEMDEDLADIVFKESVNRVYDVGPYEKRIPIDLVLASPSLEVGVDLPMLTESVMTKAIRNVASYRQKAGRIGREVGLDVVNVILVSDSPIDLHYYRQPRKLVSLGRLDPIPMKDRNQAVLNCGMYMAVWDWLALYADLPEAIPYEVDSTTGSSAFSQRLRHCITVMSSRRADLSKYLSNVVRGEYSPNDEQVKAAVNQVVDEIGLLLKQVSGTLEVNPSSPGLTIADVAVYVLNLKSGHGRARRVTIKLGHNLERLYREVEQYKEVRRTINPRELDLWNEFKTMDVMERSGVWKADPVSRIQSNLSAWLQQNPESPDVGEIRELTERILPRLFVHLDGFERMGHDSLVFTLYDQYRKLVQEETWKAHYLSTVMQSLPVFEYVRRESWFVRPDNLFSNPYERYVRLNGDAPPGQQTVTVSEALFGFIPGSWTYRLAYGCYKIRSGALDLEPGGRFVASLDNMIEGGNRFDRVSESLPPPPGLAREIDVYRPVELNLLRVKDKYIILDRATGLILDRDEARHSGGTVTSDSHGNPLVKIPRSFLNKWVHVDATSGESILPVAPEEGDFVVEREGGEERGIDALTRIRHPLFGSLLKDIQWHDSLHVTEYIYSVTRSYSGGGREGVELNFRDRFGEIALGDKFETEGMSIHLNQNTFDAIVSEIRNHIQQADVEWAPSCVKAFKAFLSESQLSDGGSLSPFVVSDITAMVLDSLDMKKIRLTFNLLVETLISLLGKPEEFSESAKRYYTKRSSRYLVDDEAFRGEEVALDNEAIDEKLGRFLEATEGIALTETDTESFLDNWTRRTLMNTFGIVALTALQEYSGANDHDIGYAVDHQSWNGGAPLLFLYDRSAFGNGCNATARRYLHILHILRHGETLASQSLPTDDFLSVLEEKLLQCPQFHTDMSALFMLSQKVVNPVGIRGLRDVEDQAREVFNVAGEVWRRLGITGPKEAWRLPLANALAKIQASDLGIAPDDLIRATTICWNGCPECVDRQELLMGGLSGRDYVDKAVLDAWFAKGTSMTDEYLSLDLRELATGMVRTGLGTLNVLRLDLPRRRLRSVWLPWTIGFEIDRESDSCNARLVMRTSDVLNLRLSHGAPTGIGVGSDSVGFKRLLWFDLIMTAYLDILGLLDSSRKEVKLVYYDCRDINFDDVGFSPRMIEAILNEAKKSGLLSGLERLSDILIWLLSRGFRISLCVDRAKSREQGVHDFLEKLERTGISGLTILTKDIEGGSMHKKALFTPVAILKGSANLTRSGSERNEEIIDHFFYGAAGYEQLHASIDDTFHGTEAWHS